MLHAYIPHMLIYMAGPIPNNNVGWVPPGALYLLNIDVACADRIFSTGSTTCGTTWP